MYHTRLSSHFIVHSRDTDGLTILYIHDSRIILTVYEGLAQARPNYFLMVSESVDIHISIDSRATCAALFKHKFTEEES